MPVYVWEGTTNDGSRKRGEMNATDRDEVTNRLRAQGLNPSKIKPKGGSLNFGLGGRVPLKSLVIFTRQYATMIDAGLPVVQCLDLLGGAEPHKGFQKIIMSVKADVEGGQTLAESMRRHPGAFNQLYTALIQAGEEAGILDTVMNRLAIEMEKSQKLRRRIRGAFTYPTIVLVIAHRVPFKVATGPVPDSPRVRMFNRRAWKSVQFEVEVISRYRVWVGSQP